MKALVQEIVGNFQKRLEPFDIQVRELTGDVNMSKEQIRETQIIITTPEKVSHYIVVDRRFLRKYFYMI